MASNRYQEPATVVDLGKNPKDFPQRDRTMPGYQEPATVVDLNYKVHSGPSGCLDNRGGYQEPATVVDLNTKPIKGGGSAYEIPMAKQPWVGQKDS